MMNLKKFILKYWVFILLAFLVAFFTSTYFINKYQPKIKVEDLLKIPILALSSYQIKNQPEYSSLEKDFPQLKKEALVFEIKKQIFSNQEAISIANRFNFKNEPTVQQDQSSKDIFYFWEDEEIGNLSINLSKGEVNYTNKKGFLFIPGIKRKLPSLNEAENFTWSFIKEKEFSPLIENTNLVLIKNQYYKDKESDIEEVNSPENADFINLSLEYQINNINVKEAAINLTIGENLEILKFNYSSLFSELKELSLYPLKGKSEILQALKNNKTINNLRLIGGDTIIKDDSQNIKNIDLNEIELVYLKTEIPQPYLQPIFFISGQAILNNERAAKVGIYLPAIKDEYLLK